MVTFADTISDAAHDAVLQLDRALARTPCPGVTESIPAYVSLLVDFDPLQTDHVAITAHLRHLLTAPTTTLRPGTPRQVAICYDDDLAPDLAAVVIQTGLPADAVIKAHLAGDYRVVMYGFAPGYAYLGGVAPPIRLDRKPAPVRGVAAGSVIIAGAQCLVTTLTMPTGWWVIGRSPTAILTTDPHRPFLFDVGDSVRFHRISRATFDASHKAPQ